MFHLNVYYKTIFIWQGIGSVKIKLMASFCYCILIIFKKTVFFEVLSHCDNSSVYCIKVVLGGGVDETPIGF